MAFDNRPSNDSRGPVGSLPSFLPTQERRDLLFHQKKNTTKYHLVGKGGIKSNKGQGARGKGQVSRGKGQVSRIEL